MIKNTVVITRGCSGAGKSTYAKEKYPRAFFCSADHFFVDESGVYNFDPHKIKIAHQFCQNAFRAALKNAQPLIVVDNTHTQLWEFEYYIDLSKKYNYRVVVVRIDADPKKAAKRNVHKVPENVVVRMYNRFEDFPDEIILNAPGM
jgi:predicted kinase